MSKKEGSFFFIGELILDLELAPDGPSTDHCGTCTACIDACPTQAIVAPTVVDSNKCISYLTIEYKKALPDAYQEKMEEWVYGCDVCQDVCPWNRFSKPTTEPDFKIHPDKHRNRIPTPPSSLDTHWVRPSYTQWLDS